jgi:predicted 3-demethylubiquinone-9 3-methyltransferase (glyoxalase superfamily)
MSKITPFLWYESEAEEAAELYTSLFPDSHVDRVNRSPADAPGVKRGDVLTVEFTLAGEPFVALNGGPGHPFNDTISFAIDCADQAEVDRFWASLILGGGEPGPCGWLKDKFGVSWQVIPKQLTQYLQSDDRDGARRAMEAMLQMSKIDVEQLREAFEGVPA